MKKIFYSLPGLLMAAALLAPDISAQTYPSLDKLFSDKACTTLAPEYASRSLAEIQGSDDYKALPSPLQKMVDKVKTGNWEEESVNIDGQAVTWDSPHALKYRVQMVEPFSDGWATSVMMDCKPHTNLNNPTGFHTAKGTTLYIMVEGQIKDGATLYFGEQSPALDAQNMGRYNYKEQVANNATPLKEGLNVVKTKDDNALSYFYYIVDTYDTDKREKTRRLSTFPSLKIHVEGGNINGFFNVVGDELYKPDTKEDLDYTLARAIHPDYALIGRSFINIFPLKSRFPAGSPSYPGMKEMNTSDYDPMPVMTRWEDLVSVIQTTAGFKGREGIEASSWADYYQYLEEDPESYADYFNNRLLNIMVAPDPSFVMYSTYWFNGIGANSSTDMMLKMADPANGGMLWGPAHEYGHTVQGPINVVGSTEISNNLFSNVVNFLMCNTTSRTEYISDLRKLFNNRQPWRDGIYWTATRMYWQLWLYYHQQGNNKQFYLRLQDILRRNPLTHADATDYLSFAKAACEASGEDLTDFFEAYGIFVPLDHYTFDDYGPKDLTLTASQIAACKAEIAAMNLPKNRQIIFIDERPGSDRESYSGYPKEKAGEMGGLKDFAEGSRNDGRYNYTFDGTTISFNTGRGGVGFIIYDKNDNLLSFGNTRSFDVSREASTALVSGTAKVYVVDSDGTLTDVKARTNTTSTLIKALNNLIEEARGLMARCSENDNIVGHYYHDDAMALKPHTDAAAALLTSSATAPDDEALLEAYTALNDAVNSLRNNPYSVITLRRGVPYSLVNAGYPSLALASNGEKLITAGTNPADKNQRWIFEPAGTSHYIRLEGDGELYIQHTNRYLSTAITLFKDPIAFNVTTLDNGNSIITWAESSNFNIHVDGSHNVVFWREGDTNVHSQWLIADIEADGRPASNLLAKAVHDLKTDMAKAGTIGITSSPIRLTEGSFDSNAKCPANLGSDAFTSWKVLTDKNPSTYFHSNWNPGISTDLLPHWISVDLREPTEEIVFSYTTRGSGNVCAPKEIKVQATDDGEIWDDITTISSGLPTANATEYKSPTIYFPKPYRKVRFMVTANNTNQQASGFYYFVISELGVGHPNYTVTPSASYPDLPHDLMLSAYKTLQLGEQTAATGDDEASAEMAERVLAAHKALLEAMADPSGIDEIAADSPAAPALKGIYDLQGRRLREVTAPGIYIIDGRKVIVR